MAYLQVTDNMTYLQLVNGVLRRLREEEVSSVSQETYSKMIGDFVNDAKKIVEKSWDWSGLKTTISVTTQATKHNYALLGSQDDIKTMDITNDTSGFFITYRPSQWFHQQFLNETPVTGTPQFYTYNGLDANGDSQVDLYSDPLKIPAEPVLHLAVALAARERGETGGTGAPEYFGIANQYLSDAISLDAQKHPYATDWYTP